MHKILLVALVLIWTSVTVQAQDETKGQKLYPRFVKLEQNFKATQKEVALNQLLDFSSNEELRLFKEWTDELGFTHYKHQQYYNGIKVEGAIYTLHSKDEIIVTASGEFIGIGQVKTTPVIEESEAFQAAIQHVMPFDYELYEIPKGELVIVADQHTQQEGRLAYKFDIYSIKPIYRAYAYVDAINGKLLKEASRLCNINVPASDNTSLNGNQSFTADQNGSTFRLRQTSSGNGIETYDLNKSTDYRDGVDITSSSATSWGDHVGTQVHWAAEQTYDFYQNAFNRNSYDGNGGVIRCYVRYDDNQFDARWSGDRAFFGEGNGTTTGPLVSLDIVGHEISHGITEYSANLIYEREPGALNESFSDIFGEGVEHFVNGSNDWLGAADIYLSSGAFLRSLKEPKDKSDPDTYDGQYWENTNCSSNPRPSNDFCGVHTNSGVQNKWFYILSEGESGTNDNGDSYMVSGIGIDKALQIAYRNLTVYLSTNSQYSDARTGAIQSAVDKYGAGSAEEIATTNAWYAVGVGDEYVVTGDTQAPSTPSNLAASNTTQTTTTLSWNASTDNVGVSSYDVYQDGTFIGNTSSTSYNVTGLTPSTSYNFYVRAKDAANNESVQSNTVQVTTSAGQTQNYCASASTSSTNYNITRVILNTIDNSSSQNGNNYQDFTSISTSLARGTSYPISIYGPGDQNKWAYSVWIDYNNDGDFSDSGEQVWNQPGIAGNPVSGNFLVPSSAVSGSTRMRVSMSYNNIPSSCQSFSYGEVEDYTVNISGGGGDNQPPSTPSNLTASSTTQTTTSLSWNPSNDDVGVSSYDVYRNGIVIGNTSSTSYNVTGLTASTTYNFYVRAKDAAGNVSGQSNTVNVTTLAGSDTQAPSTPSNLAASNTTQTSTSLSWNASTDNVGVSIYDVYRDGNVIGNTSSTSYNVTGLTASTTYSFYVRAKDAAGNVSGQSNAVNVTTLAGQTQNYCASASTSSINYNITRVILNTIDNSSSQIGNNYQDFTSISTSLARGTSYPISIYGPGDQNNWAYSVWIDYNNDGDFSDSDEQVWNQPGIAGNPVSGNFLVPSSAVSGSTRMRVSMSFNSIPSSCQSFSYGEVEDYTVNISGGGGDTQPPSTPTNLTASSTTQSTTSLSWNPSTDNVGVSGCDVYRDGSFIGNTSSTSYNVTGLTASTMYDFYVTAKDAAGNVSGPSNTEQVTTLESTSGCSGAITSYPFTEGFEGGFGLWQQATDDDIDWTRKSGSTSSNQTGPSSASEGSQYIYTESSNPNFPNKTANLVSPCFDLTSVSSPEISFQYHMYGSSMGILKLQASTNGGQSWLELWSLSGDQGNSWNSTIVDLNSYTNQSQVLLRFNGETGSSYTSDMSIDDIEVSGGGSSGPSCSDGTQNGNETGVDCGGPDCPPCSDTQAPSAPSNLTASNTTQTTTTLSWNASSDDVGVSIYDVYRDGNVIGNTSSTSHNVTGLTASTTYSFYVRAKDAAGNVSGQSNTVQVTMVGSTSSCSGAITSYPYTEGFESGFGLWQQATDDDIDWTRKSGSTSSNQTGPSSASEGSQYIYTESSNPNFPSKTANLVSPCFDLTSVSSPEISFQYHMYGSSMGILKLQASTNGGQSWLELWSLTGDQGNSWNSTIVDLNSYTNQSQVLLRFNGETGSSYTSDMSIDDIEVSGGGSSGPSCSDGTQNGNETGVDCGGPDCSPCSSGCNTSSLTLTIILDDYPDETSWSVTKSGNSVASGGTYDSQADGSTVTETISLGSGSYTFTINDSYGDGICCTEGNGSYSLVDASGSTIASGGDFGSSESTSFCVSSISSRSLQSTQSESKIEVYPNPANDVLHIDMHNISSKMISIYNSSGAIIKNVDVSNKKHVQLDIHDLSNGIYFILTHSEDDTFVYKSFIKD